jgi:hypothetical protein
VEWPLEVRVLAVCASAAAIASVVAHGIIVACVAAAVLLLIYGLVG